MNLLQLRSEALNHGFDPTQYGARVTNFINDAYLLMCARVDYYVDESTMPLSVTQGTTMYPFPADFGRERSLYDTVRNIEMQYVALRQIDRSVQSQGAPWAYALDGANIHLFPTPDNVYSLTLRYWKMPAPLVNDTDIPTIPVTWQRALWEYAVGQCYWADDDPTMGKEWDQKFMTTLAEFAADVKFPSTDGPIQAADMWLGDRQLAGRSWIFGGSW